MPTTNAICPYFYIDNNGDKHHCVHRIYRNGRFCIFHDTEVQHKGRHFYEALEALISDNNQKVLDLKGFVFPKIVYTQEVFTKEVDLRNAIFHGIARFDRCEFKSKVQMVGTQFKDLAFFQGCVFHGKIQLLGTKFEGKTVFVGATFNQKAVIHGSKFLENVSFQGANFFEDCSMQLDTFSKDADFQQACFKKNADFTKTIFHRRAHFAETRFEGEIIFNEVNFGLAKELRGKGISFDGAILETSNFWGMRRLNSYSFRNSFLINCNFSGIKLDNCDFTGAVLKSPHTTDWSCDDNTLRNTKYIYSDYTVAESVDSSGAPLKKYNINEDSRIPSSGEFLDINHKDFSLLDYAKEPYRWEFLLHFPQEIQTGIVNYINFFKDYSRITEGINIDLATATCGEKIKISLLLEDTISTEKVGSLFKRYVSHILKPFDRFDVVFSNTEASPTERELLLINLGNELAATQSRMAYALDSLPKLQQTVESLGDLIDSKVSDNSKLLDILSQAVSSRTIGTISVSPNFNNQIAITSSIDLPLAELLDLLEEARRDASHGSMVLVEISKQISEIRGLGGEQKKQGLASIFKELVRFMGKAADYGIKNADKVLDLVDRIGKMI